MGFLVTGWRDWADDEPVVDSRPSELSAWLFVSAHWPAPSYFLRFAAFLPDLRAALRAGFLAALAFFAFFGAFFAAFFAGFFFAALALATGFVFFFAWALAGAAAFGARGVAD